MKSIDKSPSRIKMRNYWSQIHHHIFFNEALMIYHSIKPPLEYHTVQNHDFPSVSFFVWSFPSIFPRSISLQIFTRRELPIEFSLPDTPPYFNCHVNNTSYPTLLGGFTSWISLSQSRDDGNIELLKLTQLFFRVFAKGEVEDDNFNPHRKNLISLRFRNVVWEYGHRCHVLKNLLDEQIRFTLPKGLPFTECVS